MNNLPEFFANDIELYQVFSKNGLDFIIVQDPEESKENPMILDCLVLDQNGKAIINNKKGYIQKCLFYNL